MSPTKQRILDQALRLFNTEGFGQMSLGRLGQALGMSKGNLAYHFANTGVILEALHAQMVSEMEGRVRPAGSPTLAHFAGFFRYFESFRTRYRFFFLEWSDILRRFPAIQAQQAEVVARRQAEGRSLLTYYIGAGWVQPEAQPGAYDRLIYTIWMTQTFWLAAELVDRRHASGLRLCWQLLEPYFTPAGRAAFAALPETDRQA
ncbi:MAG: TetR/AcrR family transcriptional regulator [Bacteroidetes bacterium]|nr:MAG: TetR/AcrR family transcriptional regulator [Bacteroidota bacterium]